MPEVSLTHLWIIANRSSVVRALVGDRKVPSSSGLDSSHSSNAAESLVVESADTPGNQ